MYTVAALIATAIILPLLGTSFIVLRFDVRLRLKPTYIGIDDCLIVVACAFVWGQAAVQIASAVHGELGRDNQKTVPWRVRNEQKLDYAVVIFEKITYSTSEYWTLCP